MRYFYVFFVLIMFSSGLFAQRFHQSLSSIVSEPHEHKIPNQLIHFHNWFDKTIDNIYFSDLQFTNGTNNSSNFYKFRLIFRKQNQFEIGKNGLKLEFLDSLNGKPNPIYLNYFETIPLLAYDPHFDPQTYNPNDFRKKFEYGLRIQSLSQPQVLANIINHFAVDDPKKSPLMYIVEDIKKRSKIKLQIDENSTNPLDSILTQIYRQTNDYPHNQLYDLYIKNSDQKKEHIQFNQFFRSYTPQNQSEIIDEYASLKGEFQVEKGKVLLRIPQNLLQIVKDESNEEKINQDLLLNVGDVHIQVVQEAQKTPYLAFNFNYFHPLSENYSFILPNEIKLNPSVISDKNRSLQVFKSTDIKGIKLNLQMEEIEVYLDLKQGVYKLGHLKYQ